MKRLTLRNIKYKIDQNNMNDGDVKLLFSRKWLTINTFSLCNYVYEIEKN